MSKYFVILLFVCVLSCKNNDNAVQFQALHESLLDANKKLAGEKDTRFTGKWKTNSMTTAPAKDSVLAT